MKLQDLIKSEYQIKTAARETSVKTLKTSQAEQTAAVLKAAQAKVKAYEDAALLEIQEMTEAMAAVTAEHAATYANAVRLKREYLAELGKLKQLEEKSGAQYKKITDLNGYVLNPLKRGTVRPITSDILNVTHTEPSAYINRAQIRAAYQSKEWESLISYPEFDMEALYE